MARERWAVSGGGGASDGNSAAQLSPPRRPAQERHPPSAWAVWCSRYRAARSSGASVLVCFATKGKNSCSPRNCSRLRWISATPFFARRADRWERWAPPHPKKAYPASLCHSDNLKNKSYALMQDYILCLLHICFVTHMHMFRGED